MHYLFMICGEGVPSSEAMSVMQRECPGWVEEMDGRGVRLLGRELGLPGAASVVGVRDGETLVSDGPFAETKEFIAGFDLIECADLDEAIEVAAKHPSSWFDAIEIRPFADRPALGAQAPAFGRGDDAAGTPYLLTTWIDGSPGDDQAAAADAWRRDLATRDLHVLGQAVQGSHTATAVRVRDGETRLADGPVLDTAASVAGIDVVSCADREAALALAATHPLAGAHAIEVRPFASHE